jgi:hypothetical protein
MVIFQEWFTEQWTFGFKICECSLVRWKTIKEFAPFQPNRRRDR